MNLQTTASDQEVWSETIETEQIEPEEHQPPFGEKLAGFVRLCWLRRRPIAAIVAVGIVLSVLYAVFSPTMYTSTTTLMPQDNTSPYSSMMNLLNSSSSYASLGGEVLGMNTPGELFISILGSRNVQDALIARYDLMRHFHSRLPEDARRHLSEETSINEDRRSGVISISVTDHDPALAANLAKSYVEQLNRVVTEGSTSAAHRERIFLEGQVRDVTQDLDNSSKLLSQFSTKNKAVDINEQAKSMVEAGLKLQADLIDGKSQVAALRETYSEDNYRVKAAEARVAELQHGLDAMSGKPGTNSSKPGISESFYPSVSELPAIGLTYYDLERKVRVDEALWESLMKQYEAAKVQEAKEIPTVRVLDVAEVPNREMYPNRKIVVMIGTLVSFPFACAFVFVWDLWERIDPQSEPKKLIMQVARSFRDRHRRLA